MGGGGGWRSKGGVSTRALPNHQTMWSVNTSGYEDGSAVSLVGSIAFDIRSDIVYAFCHWYMHVAVTIICCILW